MNSDRWTVPGALQTFVLVFLFLCLTALALAFRDVEFLAMIALGETVTSSPYHNYGRCGVLPACLRAADAWLGVTIEGALIEASRLLDLLPDRHRPELFSLPVKESYLIIFSVLLTRTLTLLPIVVACIAYRSPVLRATLIVAAFMSIFGWARSNPLFSETTIAGHDFAAIGFVFLLFALMAAGATRSFVAAAAVLVLGQLIFENLGVVTGVAVAIHGFMINRQATLRSRTRAALGRLGGFAAVSVATLAGLYLMTGMGTRVGVEGFATYFSYVYETYGRSNIREFYDIGENFLQILAYPSASGILLGLVAAVVFGREDRDADELRDQFWAVSAIWIGFACTLVIGFFLAGYYYNMGRQLLPLCVITTLVWAKGIELIVAKVRGGRARNRGVSAQLCH